MHVGGSFSSPVQLRALAGEDEPGQSGWSDPGKDALTFVDLNCADNKNNKSGELRNGNGNRTGVRRAGGAHGTANQRASIAEAVGGRWPSRDSPCGCMAHIFAWRKSKFCRYQASGTPGSSGEQTVGTGP